jgi:Condensation domain
MSTIPHRETLSETKRKLLECYQRGGLAHASENPLTITPRPKGETIPLSLAQEQIWRREQMLAGGSLPHNECITLKASKYLDPTVLERSFTEIIRRHEIWRTSYDITNGQPIQVVHEPPSQFPLRIVDLRADSEEARERELLKLYTEGIRQRFDLRRGPLLRVILVTLTSTDQRLLVFAHLSIVDGVSVYQILPAELASLCDAFSAGKTSPLGELPIQYADYAYWQRQWLKSQELARQLTYWREELAGELPVLQWPNDRPRPTVENHRGAVRSFALTGASRCALKEFSQREGVTLFTTLAASLSALLYCYTGQTEIILGTPSLGARKRSEIQALLGHFLNPVPLRIDLEADPSFHELLLRTQTTVGGAVSHDDVPLEILAQQLQLHPSSRPGSLFTVAISLQPQTPETGAGWQVTSMDADSGGTIWDLYLAFIETKDGIIGRAQYNTDLFGDVNITRTLEGLQFVLETVAGDPKQSISTLPSQLRSLGLL